MRIFSKSGRDYARRPMQGNGRDFQGYGRTQLRRKPAPVLPYVGTWFLFICALIAVGNFIEWVAPQ